MGSVITEPGRLPLVAPSIFASDFANLERECRGAMDAGGDLLHVDVMDGHFVRNLSLGPALCASLHRAMPEVYLDVHLMVREPERFIEPFAEAGASLVSFHIEVFNRTADAITLAERTRTLGLEVGIVINPPTSVEPVLDMLGAFDLALVMSIMPGFAGQAFMPEVLERCEQISSRLQANQRLEIDGGISPATAESARDAGCDVLVVGSALFGAKPADRAGVIEAVRGGAGASQ